MKGATLFPPQLRIGSGFGRSSSQHNFLLPRNTRDFTFSTEIPITRAVSSIDLSSNSRSQCLPKTPFSGFQIIIVALRSKLANVISPGTQSLGNDSVAHTVKVTVRHQDTNCTPEIDYESGKNGHYDSEGFDDLRRETSPSGRWVQRKESFRRTEQNLAATLY